MTQQPPTNTKFHLLQNHLLKYKQLKKNLLQSQKLSQTLKKQLFEIGSKSNTLYIDYTQLINSLKEMHVGIPQKEKELFSIRQELKRFGYKIEKVEIKVREYEERGRKFQEMMRNKQEKYQGLEEKIGMLQKKLQKEKQLQYNMQIQLKQLQKWKSTFGSSYLGYSNMSSVLQRQSRYSSRSSVSQAKNVSLNSLQIEYIKLQSRKNKLKYEKQQVTKRNNLLKSKIAKFEEKIGLISGGMNKEEFDKENLGRMENRAMGKQNSHNDRIINPIQLQKLQKTRTSLNPQLTSQNLTKLIQQKQQLTLKTTQIIDQIQNQTAIISQLSQINKLMQTQLLQQTSKIDNMTIKSKRQIQRYSNNNDNKKTIN